MSAGFPYQSLDRAVEVVEVLDSINAPYASPEELALLMESSATSGSFRTQLSTARQYGLIFRDRGSYGKTELGELILLPESRQNTLVTVFRGIRPYMQLCEKFAPSLPESHKELERQMIHLGASKGSVVRARRAFVRSATYAGVLGADRRSLDVLRLGLISEGPEPDSARDHPMLLEVWNSRPDDGCTREDFEEWLKMLKQAFNYLYTIPPEYPPPSFKDAAKEES